MKNKDIKKIGQHRERFVGILHFEGGGKNPYLHIDGQDLWGRVALHFWEKLEKDALLRKKA